MTPMRSLSLFTTLALAACTAEVPAPAANAAASLNPDPWRIVLAPQGGDSEVDVRIARCQTEVERATDPVPHLERLGFLFVNKARTTFDAGYYKLAEQCADCIEERQPDAPAALLLRGHVLQSLHHFERAEGIARQLVAARGNFLDHGLLGDVLLDRGDLEGALDSYQAMLDLKPCLQSYSRAARARWLRGDVDGAIVLMRLAVGAGSHRDPEPLAWSYAWLSTIELQNGELDAAARSVRRALELLPDYAPALLADARVRQHRGDRQGALQQLRQAAGQRPEPEYLWALADALRAHGDAPEAARVEAELEATGASADPRTYALYLATRRRLPEQALRLVGGELDQRHDVHTHDAHAWALHAAGQTSAARAAARKALAAGTEDARLFYHAGVIAAAAGDGEQARALLARADALRALLLPSEQSEVDQHLARL